MSARKCENRKTAATVDDVINFITSGENTKIFLYGIYPISRMNDVMVNPINECAYVSWTRPTFSEAKRVIEREFNNVEVTLKKYKSGYESLKICLTET